MVQLIPHPRDERATERAVRPSGLRSSALFLLLVLVTGLNVTTLTPNWLGAIPYHEHIFLGGHGNIPHSHAGDRWQRAASALAMIDSPTSQAEGDARPLSGVISLRSPVIVEIASGVVSLATTTTGSSLPLPVDDPRAYPPSMATPPGGESPSPNAPPPRGA